MARNHSSFITHHASFPSPSLTAAVARNDRHPVDVVSAIDAVAMQFEEIVSRHPDVVSGALVFKGTRVPVQTLIDYLKSGETLDRFLEGFPSVRREQAEAYLELTLDEAASHA